VSERTPRPEDDRPGARAAGDVGSADEAPTQISEPSPADPARESEAAAPAERPRDAVGDERPRADVAGDERAPADAADEASSPAGAPQVDAAVAGTPAASPGGPSLDELQARAAQTREEVRVADARRAEEATAQAERAAEEARGAEREARERAQRASEEAERARSEAGLQGGGSVTGASVTAPGMGITTEPRAVAEASAGSRAAAVAADGGGAASSADERPELLVGGAFVAAFMVGRLLKRILDRPH